MPVPRIAKEELKQQLEAADPAHVPVILDVRLKYPYEHSGLKLPGALRVSPDTVDVASIPRGRPVVAYDSDPDELASVRVAAHLIRQGYQAAALKGGISDWISANFPVEPKDAPKTAPPEPGALKV
jgi:rhodanese-related sulfurtransferase